MRRLDIELTHMPILRLALAAMAVWDHTQDRGSDALLMLAAAAFITLLVGLLELSRVEAERRTGRERG